MADDAYTFTFKYASPGEIIAVGLALPIVCLLVVALRFYTRSRSKYGFGMDDWLIVAGLFWVIGCGVCLDIGAFKGVMGYPTPPVPSDLSPDGALLYTDPTTMYVEKLEFPLQILMILAYGCIKSSIVFFYRRLFVNHKNSPFDIITKVTLIVLLLWTITFVLLIIFPCGIHVWANWGSTSAQLMYCPVAFTSEYGLAISDLILDLFVILMPLPLVWKLHLTTKRKLAVTGILLLGASAVGASIARLVLYVQILQGLTKNIVYDINQAISVSMYWSVLEAGLALIAACLPTLSYLFTTFSVRSVVASVRSMFSLHSMRSQRSENASTVHAGPSTGAHIEATSTEKLALEDTRTMSRDTDSV